MREVNISGLDLNLVPALDALLRHRNVTHAAGEIGLSQPAMSRALARLRDLQEDPLLVRTKTGYVLTPRARALQPLLASAVRDLREMFIRRQFDPGAERRTLRLAASDAQTVLLMTSVMARLAKDAPGVDVRVEAYSAGLYDRLDSGALDVAFALSTTPLPPGAYSEIVLEDELALIMRRRHPAARRTWTLADYAKYPHVGVAVIGDGETEIDAILATAGIKRRIALTTPHFMAALSAVGASDMVTTLSAALARRFAPTFGLVLHKPPFGDIRLRMTLICSHIRAADPFLGWFRTVVREVAAATLA
jgi:DNA-binding transcriptional LysR family regulator